MPNFSAPVIAAAKLAQSKWLVPASVSLAQFALESGYGEHVPAGSFNCFGIKAVGSQPFVTANTREVINGKSVVISQKFRKFASFDEAFDEHARLLATAPIYAPAMVAWKAGNLAGGVTLMGKHYATDPGYAKAVLSIITGQKLSQYDAPAVAPAGATQLAIPAPKPDPIIQAWQARLQAVAKAEGKPDPLPKYGADGLGGGETRNAIMAFQLSHPMLIVTGQFDDATRAALEQHPNLPPIKLSPIAEFAIKAAIDAIIPPSPTKDFIMFNFGNIVAIVVGLLPGLPDDVNKIRAVLGELVTDANDKNGIEGMRDSARFARIIADELDKVADTLDPAGKIQPSNPIINK